MCGCLLAIAVTQNQGQTPLHYAFAYNYDALLAYLISKSADEGILNHFGYSCYDGLRPDNRDEAIKLLRERLGDKADLDAFGIDVDERTNIVSAREPKEDDTDQPTGRR